MNATGPLMPTASAVPSTSTIGTGGLDEAARVFQSVWAEEEERGA